MPATVPALPSSALAVSSGIYLYTSTRHISAIVSFVTLDTICWLPHVVIVDFTSLTPLVPASLSVCGGINIFG